MTASATTIPGGDTFPRGVHPPGYKHLAEEAAIEILPTPARIRIPMLQHLGAPCEPTLKPRTDVALGDVVGEAKAFISAPVHASVVGTTMRTSVTTLPNGRHVPVVPIKPAPEQPYEGQALYERVLGNGQKPAKGIEAHAPKDIADAARRAGLVGLGGAAFPTSVKLTRNDDKPIATLLINGCECEPFLTADDRLMREAPRPIVAGALLARRATGADAVAICIEDNKPEAAASMRAAAEDTDVQIRIMKTKYPQGGEKQLILAALGKEVPTGGLPLDVGVVVMNVGTAAALERAVRHNQPLTHRIVTVTGRGVRQPKNLLAPVGADYADLIEFCGGLTPDAVRVVAGGPMMGFTLGRLDVPITKGTSGITVLTRSDVRRAAETGCLRCGRCVDVCPMRLAPTRIALAARAGRADLAERAHIAACMECGCCTYQCPAGIPLVQLIRLGKVMLR